MRSGFLTRVMLKYDILVNKLAISSDARRGPMALYFHIVRKLVILKKKSAPAHSHDGRLLP